MQHETRRGKPKGSGTEAAVEEEGGVRMERLRTCTVICPPCCLEDCLGPYIAVQARLALLLPLVLLPRLGLLLLDPGLVVMTISFRIRSPMLAIRVCCIFRPGFGSGWKQGRLV